MRFKIINVVAPYSVADPEDVHALKVVLNRLGYYTPAPRIGIEEGRDLELFRSINQFQRDKGIEITSHIFPFSNTVHGLNKALSQQDQSERYKWRTVGDTHVRDAHAAREGQTFSWAQPPDGGHPGEDYNCRCWAEPLGVKLKSLSCEAEEIAFQEASTKFQVWDAKKGNIEEKLQNLYDEHKSTIEEAEEIFGKLAVIEILSPNNTAGAFLDFLTDQVTEKIADANLRKNSIKITQIRMRIQYFEQELRLVLLELERAIKEVIETKGKLEICRNSKD